MPSYECSQHEWLLAVNPLHDDTKSVYDIKQVSMEIMVLGKQYNCERYADISIVHVPIMATELSCWCILEGIFLTLSHWIFHNR